MTMLPWSDGRKQDPMRVSAVLTELVTHPKRSFVDSWNWKAGSLSVFLRAPIYMIATVRHGPQAVAMAGLVEGLFSAAFAGVYAALTEAIEGASPQWAVGLLLLVVLPVVALAMDAFVHHYAGTPNLRSGVAASLVVSVVSSAFNWYSMRRGALLVGRGARSFGSDLSRLPLLIGRFLLEPVLVVWRGTSSCSNER